MKAALERILRQAWQRRGPLALALWPAAQIYGALLKRRAAQFARSPQIRLRPGLPVIVVGNMVVGGVGKTPVVTALVMRLLQMGFNPGVISRGYGRNVAEENSVLAVTRTSAPAAAGDEPVMIASQTGVPVYVSVNRPAAMQALLAAHPEVDVIVSDDGLQHWALARDIEIIVWDERGRGNGWLLPAGMLREPWPRQPWHPYAQKQALHLLSSPEALPAQATVEVAWPVVRKLATYAVLGDGSKRKLAQLRGQQLCAVAGIAKPEAFFTSLRAQGLLLERTVVLPDHADMAAWWNTLSLPERGKTWLCTEKDAIKLWQVCPSAHAIPLEIELAQAFWAALNIHIVRAMKMA